MDKKRVGTSLGEMYVEIEGKGPAVFCWPSLFCDSRILRPIVDELSRDHQVICVDGPGHGRSAPGGRFTLEDCADAAMRVLDDLRVDRAAWIGVAWGGHVGVATALRHPDRLRALVTTNSPLAEWSTGRRAMFWSMFQFLRWMGPTEWLARAIAAKQIAPGHLARDPELVTPIVECIRNSQRCGFVDAVRSAMLDRPSLLPRLGEVRVPTLFVTGADDPLYPVETARSQAAAIARSRFVAIEGTAHLSPWEDPARVLPLIREFITSHAVPEPRSPPA